MISKFSLLRSIVVFKRWVRASKTELLGLLGLFVAAALILAGVAFNSYLLWLLGALIFCAPICMMIWEVFVLSLTD